MSRTPDLGGPDRLSPARRDVDPRPRPRRFTRGPALVALGFGTAFLGLPLPDAGAMTLTLGQSPGTDPFETSSFDPDSILNDLGGDTLLGLPARIELDTPAASASRDELSTLVEAVSSSTGSGSPPAASTLDVLPSGDTNMPVLAGASTTSGERPVSEIVPALFPPEPGAATRGGADPPLFTVPSGFLLPDPKPVFTSGFGAGDDRLGSSADTFPVNGPEGQELHLTQPDSSLLTSARTPRPGVGGVGLFADAGAFGDGPGPRAGVGGAGVGGVGLFADAGAFGDGPGTGEGVSAVGPSRPGALVPLAPGDRFDVPPQLLDLGLINTWTILAEAYDVGMVGASRPRVSIIGDRAWPDVPNAAGSHLVTTGDFVEHVVTAGRVDQGPPPVPAVPNVAPHLVPDSPWQGQLGDPTSPEGSQNRKLIGIINNHPTEGMVAPHKWRIAGVAGVVPMDITSYAAMRYLRPREARPAGQPNYVPTLRMRDLAAALRSAAGSGNQVVLVNAAEVSDGSDVHRDNGPHFNAGDSLARSVDQLLGWVPWPERARLESLRASRERADLRAALTEIGKTGAVVLAPAAESSSFGRTRGRVPLSSFDGVVTAVPLAPEGLTARPVSVGDEPTTYHIAGGVDSWNTGGATSFGLPVGELKPQEMRVQTRDAGVMLAEPCASPASDTGLCHTNSMLGHGAPVAAAILAGLYGLGLYTSPNQTAADLTGQLRRNGRPLLGARPVSARSGVPSQVVVPNPTGLVADLLLEQYQQPPASPSIPPLVAPHQVAGGSGDRPDAETVMSGRPLTVATGAHRTVAHH